MQWASISCFQEWQILSAHYLLQHRTEQSQTLVMRYFQWLSHIELLRACYYLYRTRIWFTSGTNYTYQEWSLWIKVQQCSISTTTWWETITQSDCEWTSDYLTQ
jgi:hypothetical protein